MMLRGEVHDANIYKVLQTMHITSIKCDVKVTGWGHELSITMTLRILRQSLNCRVEQNIFLLYWSLTIMRLDCDSKRGDNEYVMLCMFVCYSQSFHCVYILAFF